MPVLRASTLAWGYIRLRNDCILVNIISYAETKTHSFQVILGSDLIYNMIKVDLLKDVLMTIASRDSTVYFTCKLRYKKDFELYNLLKSTLHVDSIFYDNDYDVYLYKMSKR